MINCSVKISEREGLTVEKSKYNAQNITYLGFKMVPGKRSPSEVKINAIQEYPIPKIKTQVQSL